MGGLIASLLLVHVIVFADSEDTTKFNFETLNIYPEAIEGAGWDNIDRLYSHDLVGDALIQDFDSTNSATLHVESEFIETNDLQNESGTSQPPSENSNTDSTDIPEPDSQSETNEDDAPTDEDSGSLPEEVPSDEPAPSSDPIEEVNDQGSDTVVPEDEVSPEAEPTSDVSRFSPRAIFARITGAVPFALEHVVTENNDSTSPIVDAEADIPPQDEGGEAEGLTEVHSVSGVDDSTTSQDLPESTPVPLDTGDDSLDSSEFVDESDEAIDSSTSSLPTDESIETIIDDVSSSTNESGTEESSIFNCVSISACAFPALEFAGFSLPDLGELTQVESAHIRMSLGGEDDDSDEVVTQLRVGYTFDGVNWTDAGMVLIEDEVTNALNGGYYLFALPEALDREALAGLTVRVLFLGSPDDVHSLYVDSLWIEINAVSFFEEGVTEVVDEVYDYERALTKPLYNELLVPPSDFLADDLPIFHLAWKSQDNLVERFFDWFSDERSFEVISTSLSHTEQGAMQVAGEVTYHDDGEWTYQVREHPQKLMPGKYELRVVVEEDGDRYEDTLEFFWGVLAVNTNKSQYFPNETVHLSMAALTDRGDTICNADLRLTITDPSLTVREVPVVPGGDCGPNNVTSVPDYVATFSDTADVGQYRLALTHYSKEGVRLFETIDTFEVNEYIPYDIERSAPTRIYPPAPYDVTISITAHRSFEGRIKEKLPRGFLVLDSGGGTVSSFGEENYIEWDAKLDTGESLELAYTFDAPDISPYLYLLGPLDMDGFRELRSWQIASDALGGVAWLTSTGTESGTDLNSAVARLMWGTSTIDGYYFDHSTTSEPYKLTVRRDGDYLLSLALPLERTDANSSRTRIGAEVRVNGVVVPDALGRSSYIRNAGGHAESSSHMTLMLSDLSANDYIEVFVEGLTTIDAADNVVLTDQAALYVEFIGAGETVFTATSTFGVFSTSSATTTNLNLLAAPELVWTETRQDTGFVHSDVLNPQDITISNVGSYLVTVNVPLTGTADQQNILGRVRLNGTQIPGGVFGQGYMRPGTESDDDTSIHWSGVVTATTSNQVLTVTLEREANAAGTVSITSGAAASIYIQELPTTDVIVVRGTDLTGGTDWSVTPAQAIEWEKRDVIDTGVYTHATTTNPEDITVLENGDYLLTFNGALTAAVNRANVRVTVEVDGAQVLGAESKSFYIRNQNNHSDSSGALTYLLEGLTVGQVINVMVQEEATAGVVNDSVDAVLMIWKKAELNVEPQDITFYDEPFDSILYSSTTPKFEFSSVDPDGSSGMVYQISWSTSSTFDASTTKSSDSDSGFSNTASSSDTSPFTEGERIRYQVQSGDAFSYNTTYYWRVRATDVNGSGFYSDWSSTQSMTIVTGVEVPEWEQTDGGQFDTNILTLTESNDSGSIEVTVPENTEALVAYAESTNQTFQYRIWDGINWSIEDDGLDVGGVINWVVTEAASTRDEYIVGTLDANNDVNFQVYSASTTSWGNQIELTTTVSNAARRGLAVAYETLSGDALAIACDGDADPSYRIWNGSSWSATSTINLNSSNNCEIIMARSNPTSDEIILLARDTGSQYEALVWTGSTWIESQVIGSMQAGDEVKEGMALAYEESGNQALIVTTNGTTNGFIWNSWNGTNWGTNFPVTLGNDFENGRLTADVGTDRLTLCYIDEDADIGGIMWDGDAWGSQTEFTTTGNDDRGRAVDCMYETLPGRDGYQVAPYSDTGADGDYVATATSTSWTSNQSASDINDAFWVQTVRTGDGLVLALHFDDETDDIDFTYWNGSTWASQDTLEDTPSSVATPNYETGMMAAKRYVSETGTVRSNPINHSAVPGQPTWGDVYFNTTEAVGTDVSVQVYYTDTSTCDTLVPDGDLAGNSTGFDATDSPIDISGLATSTYSQLCLFATLTQNGGTSPTLDSWRVTWERTPYVSQSNFRWYTNGSYITPTDPWPAGVNDLGEGTSITASEAINTGDEIRLRMSLAVENIDLATSSESFALQYGEGESCALIEAWYDVGDTASSSALWRGYENAIVGDDWYSGNWSRRIKVTVDSTLVEDTVTDFPTYINLADLPTGFFNAVQSDGDDIRITEADGVTEVPFDLVSINTGGETGELHFKADLSSTTDAEYYLYYGNATATGYSPSATYGSRNVWTSSYSLRYALDDNPAGASPQFTDSTSNSNDAVARAGMTSGDVVTGQIGSAIDLDGNDGGVFEVPLAYSGTFTASLWWNSTGDGFALAGPAGANEKMGPWNAPAGRFFVRTLSSSDTGVNSPADGSWAYVVLTRDSSNKVDIYVNGSSSRLYSDVAQSGTSDWENFGGETSQGFLGRIDELRFASVKRSTGWIQTEYNNQSNPTGFYTVSAEELISDGRTLSSVVLSTSEVTETYEEESPTLLNVNAIPVSADGEWDFVLQNNNAAVASSYCFRLVYSDGRLIDDYTVYPQLITNAPPPAPSLTAPFDNEKLASTTPHFEFAVDDDANDDVTYQVQIDTDSSFGSPDIENDSGTHSTRFTNLAVPADKDPFTSGQTIQFIPGSALTNNTTYWWRVRAKDPNGSNAYGDWSDASSFTIDGTVTLTTWFQTTDEQFTTDTLEDATPNGVGEDVRITTSFTYATVTSNAIDFDDGGEGYGNAWGELSFTDDESSGDIHYALEYFVEGTTWDLIPDTDLAGNSAGFDAGPITLTALDTDTYNTIRIRAVLTDSGGSPRLQDWTLSWGNRVETPTLITPFDNAKVATVTPTFTFTATDPEGDAIEYEFSFSTSSSFSASTTYLSSTSGFVDQNQSTATNPYPSGHTLAYTIQGGDALTSSSTYWWRVRARDPLGANVFSFWSEPRSITVDESIVVSTWFQTTGEQFETNIVNDIQGNTVLERAEINTTLREVMVAYGEGSVQSPRYRLWDGSEWGDELTAESVGAQIDNVVLVPSPTRNEYALGTLGTDGDTNVQIYNGDGESWGDLTELTVSNANTNLRGFDVAYETISGNLIAVSCDGTEAVMQEWNGTSWSATSSVSLANANTCLWIKLASNPSSNEIVMVVRSSNTGALDYEALVWDGSVWSDSIELGNMAENAHEGIAVEYEESGDQAVVIVANDGNPSFIYTTWDGASWQATSTATATLTIGDDFEWGKIARDSGSDALALCYIDEDADLGYALWDGTQWGARTEFETLGNAKQGRPVSCEFETEGARDGYLMIPYSDDGAGGAGDGGKYQYYATSSLNGELDLDAIEDSYNVISTRSADGAIIALFLDDTNDDYVASTWDGASWSTPEILDTNPSVTGTPFNESIAIAPRVYPAFTSGTLRSTSISYSDGTGPRWERVLMSDTTPGSSVVTYQVYYDTGTTTALVPESYLPGNAVGFTSSPIDLTLLDKNIHSELELLATFTCDSGDCPTLENWAVEWAEGIDISGYAYEYDATTTVNSGTVAVAVNGVLQPSKTATVQGDGSWTIDNVTVFEGDSVLVFMDGAIESDESLAATIYDGVGDMGGLTLAKRHLTIGSNDVGTTTHAPLSGYDFTDDEDIFMSITSNDLTLCADTACHDARLMVKAGAVYQPGTTADTSVHDFVNYGRVFLNGNTLRVSGSWYNYGSTSIATSTVILTATSSLETFVTASTSLDFYNLTFGESSGNATWTIPYALNVDGALGVTFGTLSRGTSSITVAGNVTIAASGTWSGIGTTTFDGSGSSMWTDASPSGANIGRVVINGTTKTVTQGSSVRAQSVTIGSDDTLDASSGSYTLSVLGSWNNTNTFVPQNGTVAFLGTTTETIVTNGSSFNNLTFNASSGIWYFSTSTLTLSGSLTIATGTVTLPSGTTTIGASFLNTGGTFLHNNGTVVMNSSASGRLVTLSGTAFLNAFYNVRFSGSGGWTFTDTNATTSENVVITAGTVTFPTGSLTIGADLITSGSGAFSHNSGEVIFRVKAANTVSTNGSSFHSVRVRGGTGASWYSDSWAYRIPISIDESAIDADLTNFPVYINLDDLPSSFFSAVASDGKDIRATLGDGTTEVPIEVVAINTSLGTGEVYVRASSVSGSSDTTLYLYFGNSGATAYASTSSYGAQAVWSNGYVLVEHMGDLTTASVQNSATSSLNGTKTSAGNPAVVTTGKIYSAQDVSGDSISHGDVIANDSQFTASMWMNADNLTGSGDTATYGYTLFGISPAAAPYTWLTAGGTGATDEFRFCAYSNSTSCTATVGADISTGVWNYVSVTAVDGASTTIRVNGTSRASFTNAGDGVLGAAFTIGDLRPARNINFDGRIDEVRVSNVTRADAWRDAEYRNMATTTDFYSVSSVESGFARRFSDTNVTLLGNYVAELGGDAIFPSGVLSIGGSFDNDATFDANGGTVRFNSTSGSESIAAGTTSTFATLEFNSASGDFTMTESATATTAINLTNVSQFTLASGQTLTTLGSFTNAASGTLTTWTGSTLIIGGGGSTTLNVKTHGGDAYGTLRAASSTLVRMWNSSATTYETLGTSSAVYSQDHAGVDGDLTIYGAYTRASGNEYWSYATDFDGTALGTSTARQVDVRIASGSVVTLGTSTLSLVGSSTASTTIDAVSGTYDLIITAATVTAQYFTASGTGPEGIELRASTTLSSFSDGSFAVPSGRSGVSIDGATVNRNASSQFYRMHFATTTAGTATNVTLLSSSTNFIWFREGGGNLYGEAYDGGDDNPGSVRFDDSSLNLTLSGTVLSADGSTPLGAPTCGVGGTPVRVVVENGGTFDGACDGSGNFSISGVSVVGDPTLTIFLNGAPGGERGVIVTKTPTSDISGLRLIVNRTLLRHEDSSAMSIADMIPYDSTDDADVLYTAATGTLTVYPNTGLVVSQGKTFTPGGTVTLSSSGSGATYDGSLYLEASSTFTGAGTSTYSIGGSLFSYASSTFIPASSTVFMTATTTGKTFVSSSSESIAFHNLTFTGVGGGWNVSGNIRSSGDIFVSTGTVSGTGNITLTNGSFYGDGLVSLGGGTTTLTVSNTLGGATAWTFHDLTLGTGSTTGTTSKATTATTTVSGRLTIGTGHFARFYGSLLNLTGSGTVFVENGTFVEATSTVRYSGTSGSNVLSTTYYNLEVNGTGGTPTFTATGLGIVVTNGLTIGGSANTTLTLDTNDPALDVNGDTLVRSGSTFVGSGSAVTTLGGSFDNDGTFTSSGGTITFDGSGTHTIAQGASSFANLTASGTGAYTLTESGTTTGAFRLRALGDFTVSPGVALAVGATFVNGLGGGDTTWAGSTLHLYGSGNYEVNGATTTDTYERLTIGAGTQIRMWNSDASTYDLSSTASLYSMDHAGVNGNLYIFGAYSKTSGTDYWNYATDFNGTSLTGGSERQVDVRVASGTSILYTGGGLSVIGDVGASTTIGNQGSGTYSMRIGGTASTSMSYYAFEDMGVNGLTFSGTPNVVNLSNGSFTVGVASGTAITVGGTAITQNPARTFTHNGFSTTTGGLAFNVTATGTTASSWRFTNHTGTLSGESYDIDPDGDPGYIVWDDSAALLTISGYVFSDDGVATSTFCDGSTNITLRVAGLTTYQTACGSGTGFFSISNVSYSPGDSLVAYIDGEPEKGATVSEDPVTNISNFHIYENRVIVRHEGSDPLSISDMAIWDSSDDADIPFTAVDGGTDTLALPSGTKLLVWTGKEFEPNGNVTLAEAGGGAHDGTLELQDNATFDASGSESHSIGGSLVMGSGAMLDDETSTFTFTTSGAGRTIDTNEYPLYNLTLNGSGNWTIANANLDLGNSLTITQGTLTLPSGTTTIGGSFTNTAGSFVQNGGSMYFVGAGAKTIRTGGGSFGTTTFGGTGTWTYQGTHATTTGNFTIASGTVQSATGTLTIGGNFTNNGTFTHQSGTLRMISALSSTTINASTSDLGSVTIAGTGTFLFTDPAEALAGTLTLLSGTTTLSTSTFAIAGSLISSGGVFIHSTGTVLFNSSDTGEVITPGNSTFNNLSIAAPSGGYTITGSATTTGNFSLTSASVFTLQSGATLSVLGVFTNSVGGAPTTWTGTTLRVLTGSEYSVNTKSAGGDAYNNLILGNNTDLRLWNSMATTTLLDAVSSLYSQNNAAVSGELYIYGNYVRTTGADYWSAQTDFDGAVIASRAVTVRHAQGATSTFSGGTLEMIGTASATTTLTNQGSGTYSVQVTGGTLNAQYYAVRNSNTFGLVLSGTTTVTSLNYGDYELAVSGGSLITISSTTLNYNASAIVSGLRFATTTAISGVNVALVGTTSSAWTFTNHRGNIDGEAFDSDGGDNCGSVRWDDSSCLLTQESAYRWRNDDGGEGVPDSEWYDLSWTKRKRVTFTNADATEYSNAVLEVELAFDGDMQADFDDLRVTAGDGVTPLDFTRETYTASTEATLWIEVPTLTASSDTTVYVYYGNGSAVYGGVGTTTFMVYDDFEDDNLTEYSGEVSLFDTDTTFGYQGTYGLEASNPSGRTADGIYRTNASSTLSQGHTLRYFEYIDTTVGSFDEACTLFAVQGNQNNNYAVCLEQVTGTDRLSISRDVDDNDQSGTVLATTTVAYTTGWYEVEVDWGTDDTIAVTLLKNDAVVATTSVNNGTYTTGGIGFTFWFQNGGWDYITSRPLLTTEPTTTIGSEQVPGGATWAAALNTALSGADVGEVVRPRFLIENTGLTVSDQYRLMYAAKGASPSCESVSSGSYSAVPVQASCGTSPLCMVTSSYVANNDATTDILGGEGSFTTGAFIEDPSNTTASISLDADEFTEVEYAIAVTNNASDPTYCLRVSDAGTAIDSYTKVAELGLIYTPNISSITFNNGADITLTPGGTTTVYATGTVSDQNGYADIVSATTTMYRSGVGTSCSADQNNCYIAGPSSCTYTNCLGNSCDIVCRADFYFFAEATDVDSTYDAESWGALLSVQDQSGLVATQTAPFVELLTLRALSATDPINYGSLEVNADTGSTNASTTFTNLGNDAIDILIEGTDLTDGVSSIIPVTTQKFATSTFTYSSCVFCSSLTASSSLYELDLTKPTSTSTPVTDELYWGISIPYGVSANAHSGANIFYATGD